MRLRFAAAAAALLALCSFVPVATAQVTNLTNQTSTPIPGAGHDYIHMVNETVNPGNGSVSIRIGVPVPPGRKLTLPFSLAYDSNGAHHPTSDGSGNLFWLDNTAYLAKGGWAYSVPFLSNVLITEKNSLGRNCLYYDDYVFNDATGGTHPLYLAAIDTPTDQPDFLYHGE